MQATDSDQVAGCGLLQFRQDQNDRVIAVQLLHSYPAGVYDDLFVSAVKKARFGFVIPNKDMQVVFDAEDYSKPALSAKECRDRLGIAGQ